MYPLCVFLHPESPSSLLEAAPFKAVFVAWPTASVQALEPSSQGHAAMLYTWLAQSERRDHEFQERGQELLSQLDSVPALCSSKVGVVVPSILKVQICSNVWM